MVYSLVMPVLRRSSVPLLALALALALAAAAAPAARAAGLAATQRTLAAQMAGAGASGAYVIDLDTGRRLYASRPAVPRIPASVNKLFTTSTALTRFGARGRLLTDVLAAAEPDARGVVHGNLYLRGGGDPSFGYSQATRFARAIRRQGVTRVTGRVVGDESAWDHLRGGPSSGYKADYWVGPLSALSYDHGLTGASGSPFQSDPPSFAAGAFARALKGAGVRVGRSPAAGITPAAATPLLSWASPPMATLIARTNTPSDNYMAEELLKAIGARFGLAGSTGAGATVVRATVEELGARPALVDGSGLSRRDHVSPHDVVDLLRSMDESPLAAPFEASLPVMGRTGTLSDRLRSDVARGRCHAKTGTLSDVSALAGFCDTIHGRRVAFAFMMNHMTPYAARLRQDRMTAALARLR
jgi:D-alanyl-D-alanine carboxypeptidase/D-alanyl-D-alanine-endopeptidase (penicillin-binding protein 4)